MHRVPKLLFILGVASIGLLAHQLLTGPRVKDGYYKEHKNGGIALGITGALHAALSLLSK